MEHNLILPGASLPAQANSLPPELLTTFAAEGLQSLLFAPIPKVARALAGFDREQLGAAIEVMIAMLDAADPDPEAEEIPVEDAMVSCDIPPDEDATDPDLEEIDEREPDADTFGDTSWTEWHTRGRDKLNPGVNDKMGYHLAEDAEDDDPAGGNVTDDPHDAEEDYGGEELGELDEAEEGWTPEYGIDQTTPIPDGLVISEARSASRRHRDRIRSTRCHQVRRGRYVDFRVRYLSDEALMTKAIELLP